MKYLPVIIVFIILGFFLYFAVVAFASQETCPQDNGWTKIDSDDLSLYPVSGATYCFKAGSDNSRGCNGGIFNTWPQPEGTCGLSHWSYFVAQASPTPSLSPNPFLDDYVSPTATPSATLTPTVTVTPTPSPTPSDPVSDERWEEVRKSEGETFGPAK